MKQIGLFVFFFVLTTLLLPGSMSAQVWVEKKPVPTREQMKIPPKSGEGSVLLPGRWLWYRPAKKYIWLHPEWMEPPKNKTWSPGYWKPVREGWQWVPGKWERKNSFRNWKNLW